MESTDLPPHSRAHGWSRSMFNQAEMEKFLVVTTTMGIINYPELENYWSTSWPYTTSAFSKVFKLLTLFSICPSLTHTMSYVTVYTLQNILL